jgi:hypothetical protein
MALDFNSIMGGQDPNAEAMAVANPQGGFMEMINQLLGNQNVLRTMAETGTELDPKGAGGMLGRPAVQNIARTAAQKETTAKSAQLKAWQDALIKLAGGGKGVDIASIVEDPENMINKITTDNAGKTTLSMDRATFGGDPEASATAATGQTSGGEATPTPAPRRQFKASDLMGPLLGAPIGAATDLSGLNLDEIATLMRTGGEATQMAMQPAAKVMEQLGLQESEAAKVAQADRHLAHLDRSLASQDKIGMMNANTNLLNVVSDMDIKTRSLVLTEALNKSISSQNYASAEHLASEMRKNNYEFDNPVEIKLPSGQTIKAPVSAALTYLGHTGKGANLPAFIQTVDYIKKNSIDTDPKNDGKSPQELYTLAIEKAKESTHTAEGDTYTKILLALLSSMAGQIAAMNNPDISKMLKDFIAARAKAGRNAGDENPVGTRPPNAVGQDRPTYFGTVR